MNAVDGVPEELVATGQIVTYSLARTQRLVTFTVHSTARKSMLMLVLHLKRQ